MSKKRIVKLLIPFFVCFLLIIHPPVSYSETTSGIASVRAGSAVTLELKSDGTVLELGKGRRAGKRDDSFVVIAWDGSRDKWR